MDKVYWDSVCFLALLMEETGRIEVCEEVLADAEDGRLKIVTSALTIAEVLAIRSQPKIPVSMKNKVEDFFKNEFITVRGITRKTAERARVLVWDAGITPKDALHVATALEAGLQMLHTFDGGLLKKSEKVGGTPLLSIQRPHVVAPRLRLGKPNVEEERAG